MPRKLRFSPPGVPQHIIQRGNNRQACFGRDEDFAAYLHWLEEYSVKFSVSIHAWVLMTNHVHLFCTPASEKGISLMMQSLGRMYVRYFNYTYKRTGTLWEGRYKSCLVNADDYLFHLYRYIELNPVRAGMVDDPSEYIWSSYRCNGLGKASALQTAHPLYLALGADQTDREQAYRSLFTGYVELPLLTDIRDATNTGLVLGNDRFVKELELLHGVRLRPQSRGRPSVNC